MLGVVGSITEAVPALIPVAVNQLFSSTVKPVNGEKWTLGEAYDSNKIIGKADSCEIGIDLSDAAKAADIIIGIAEDYPFAGIVALRYVKKSKAQLAFTKFDTTCTIELPAAYSDRSQRFYDKVLTELEEQDIAYTLHWGQYNEFYTPERVRNSWGAAVDSWINARNAFLSQTGQKTFSNEMIRKFNLSI